MHSRSLTGIVAALGLLAAGSALATPIEMTLSSGSDSANPTSTTLMISYSNNTSSGKLSYTFDGWSINVSAFSNSPGITPWGLELQSLTAACGISAAKGGCAPLTISISDIGFTGPVGELVTGLSDTQNGMGSVSQSAYIGSGDSYFQQSSLIGSVTLNGTGGSSAMGGAGASGDYSLTLVDTFTATCTAKGCTSFSTDGDITATPEPGTLALFGAGLLGCAIFVGRRRRASRSQV